MPRKYEIAIDGSISIAESFLFHLQTLKSIYLLFAHRLSKNFR